MFGAHAHSCMWYKTELAALAHLDEDKIKTASSMQMILQRYDVYTRRLARLLEPHVMRRVVMQRFKISRVHMNNLKNDL